MFSLYKTKGGVLMFEDNELERLNNIHSAIVYLDDNIPEDKSGIIRVGSVQFFAENGDGIDDTDLNNRFVDNQEFHAEGELIRSIAKRLEISVDNIEIVK